MKPTLEINGALEPCPSFKRPSALGECTLDVRLLGVAKCGDSKEHCVTCCGPDPSWKVRPRFLLGEEYERGPR